MLFIAHTTSNNDDKQVKIDNLYKQKEIYFSSANEYTITDFWKISGSYDFMWNNLDADVYGFVKPDRISQYLSVATALDFNRVKLQASALGTFIHDRIKGQEAPKDKHIFTPAIFVNGYPLRNKDLSIRAFYKQSFRMPTLMIVLCRHGKLKAFRLNASRNIISDFYMIISHHRSSHQLA